jgi:5-methylcytosine-specific restriction endonuclease McrA
VRNLKAHILNAPTACTKCGKVFPWTSEHFRSSTYSPTGCKQPCRVCKNARGRGDTITHKVHLAARRKALYGATKERRKTYFKAYRESHKEQLSLKAKRWAEANKERRAATSKLYQQSHKEETKARSKLWAQTHKDRVSINAKRYYYKHLKESSERKLKWQKENPLKCSISWHKRRVTIKNGSFTAEDIESQYQGQKGCCWWCGKKIKGKYHIDHRIPLYEGGAHDRNNIVISCPTCNLRKGKKLPQEWAGRLL